jgi:predicted DNA binding CopG/RHH family protein
MPAKSVTTWNVARKESDTMNPKKQSPSKTPKFRNEEEEAGWWASAQGRAFLKAQSAAGTAKKRKGSPLVSALTRAASVQIALRLPAPDLAKARELANQKGIGYQTLLKMLVHDGLRREARRP